MDCLFISDIHGKTKHLKKFFEICEKEKPEAVFIGGDVLPNQLSIKKPIEDFLKKEFFLKIKNIKKMLGENIRFFVILGNDDPRSFEKYFIDAEKKKIINYIHFKTVNINNLFSTGYAFVPPTPFQLKDWEKYDVSRYVDVGAISPEEGLRTVEINDDVKRYSTISEDLAILSKNSPPDKTIFLFHAPPYNSFLDRASLDDLKVDHAPLDIHIGSVAIKKFIENKQPLLTLHGHAHESARLTGHWFEKIGKTFCFSAANDGPELAIIRFDTEDIKNATRQLIDAN